MYLKKRMRTLVISGKGMKRITVFFCLLCVAGIIAVLTAVVSKLPAVTAERGIEIISGRYGIDGADDLVKEILGFDPMDKKTIFYGYYSLFSNVDTAEASVESPPPEFEVQTVQNIEQVEEENQEGMSEVQKVEEIKISKGMEISNMAGLAVDVNELLGEELHIKLDDKGPQVLIIHTHTTESFMDSKNPSGNDRSTDNSENMVAVGTVIKEILQGEGIEVIHDTTVHDYPSYSGAYTRSKATVTANLEKYPSIKVVLDIHRDGIVREDGTKVKVSSEINGEKTAQCMFVVGSDAQLKHDYWKDNMRLACKLQKYAEDNFPGLMRPIILRKERFNQQISKGAIIVEVGSNGNTLEEAKTGAKYMAKTIAAVLKGG